MKKFAEANCFCSPSLNKEANKSNSQKTNNLELLSSLIKLLPTIAANNQIPQQNTTKNPTQVQQKFVKNTRTAAVLEKNRQHTQNIFNKKSGF